jgi:ankyrin repeat protein
MNGANPNIVGDGSSPLHEAALKGDSGMVKVLLEYGADVNALSKDGRLPLHDAALGGNAEAVNALMSSGADVTAQTRREKQTALHIAAAWGRIEVIKLLISAKAPTSIKDAAGRTPLEEAVTNAQAEAVAVLQQVVH